jgi:hypothetical protein
MGTTCSTMHKIKAKTNSASNPDAKRPLGISRGRWKDNTEWIWKVLRWLKRQAFVRAVMSFHLNI